MSSTEAHHQTRTLWLAGALHAFTHVYQVALLPLYLLIQADFGLPRKEQSTALVTAMMAAYFLPAYPVGVLADRFSRKKLLGFGLLINALGFLGLGCARSYPAAVACVVVAGVGGSFFHPTATGLIARLFPANTGRALGLLGIGASVGFFLGPIYSGWHAAVANNWRVPVIVLGGLGVVGAALFAWLAEEAPSDYASHPTQPAPTKLFATPMLALALVGMAVCLSMRDFTGSSMGSLGSLFLQQAHGFSLQQTGVTLSAIFLASAVSNPLFGHLSERTRIRWTCFVLLIAAAVVAVFPHLPAGWMMPAFAVYGFFFMASYPIVEAALMEIFPDAVRGRVFGLFITIGGLLGNVSHYLSGRWVDNLGDRAHSAAAYHGIYAGLAVLIVLSLTGLFFLNVLRRGNATRGSLVPQPGDPRIQLSANE